mmetsp:Transcript_18383/g.31343  ORF Transcript_18383/g.31343 Transcript_18383/m.31343 type:complete len:138 (+) Transcript_18383:695-1108(+)
MWFNRVCLCGLLSYLIQQISNGCLKTPASNLFQPFLLELSLGSAAVFDYATGGPCFGPADLVIGAPQAAVLGGFAGPNMEDTSVGSGSLKSARSTIGGAYETVPGWPVSGTFSLAEVEVYCNSAVKADEASTSWWPF